MESWDIKRQEDVEGDIHNGNEKSISTDSISHEKIAQSREFGESNNPDKIETENAERKVGEGSLVQSELGTEERRQNAKSDPPKYAGKKAFSKKTVHGSPQAWSQFVPSKIYNSGFPYANCCNTGPGSNFYGPANGYLCPFVPRSYSAIPPNQMFNQAITNVKVPEVVTPNKSFNVKGKTTLQLQQLIEDFGDQWYDNGVGNGTQAAADLANQIFMDNNELLYVLITDIASYPVTSKPDLWNDENDSKVYGSEQSTFDEAAIALNCLFNVGEDIFTLFVFSPTNIIFKLEAPLLTLMNESKSHQKVTRIFFHGKTRVAVSNSPNTRIITINFLQNDSENLTYFSTNSTPENNRTDHKADENGESRMNVGIY